MAKKKSVDVATIEKAKKHLEKVPEKQPTAIPLADALMQLKPTIEEAIAKGYTREEVAAMLTEKGMDVKPYHLKALFTKPKGEA